MHWVGGIGFSPGAEPARLESCRNNRAGDRKRKIRKQGARSRNQKERKGLRNRGAKGARLGFGVQREAENAERKTLD